MAPPPIDPLRVLHERPGECAQQTLDPRQRVALVCALVVAAAAVALWPREALLTLNAALLLFTLIQSAYKLYLLLRSLGLADPLPEGAGACARLSDAELPTYTILVPLFQEAAVLPKLVAGICRLDYPTDKLQVQLLLEEADTQTIAAANAMDLPTHFLRVVVPDSYPRTKPKACNWGLDLAESDLLVIFDAEDIPEPDQLRKAADGFASAEPRVACLQAKLNYFNPRQNLLTRWFTAEYSVWFDLLLPGLTSTGAPIPLGGTSNHFRVGPLRELGGWDPFNVTEDCDLGIRLHRHGYRADMLNSTTWEEANSRFWSWIRQRSRWVKGYLQTYLVHMRQPVLLWRQLGPAGWFSFQMTVGGALVAFLANPLYWVLSLAWLATHADFISALFPTPVYAAGLLGLVVGNFAFVYLNVAGCVNRGYWDLAKYALLTPLYWLMMSWAAYKAAAQLVVNPHYWEKTQHGLSEEAGP